MNVITVTKMRENLNTTISAVSNDEPITIQKNNKDVAVLISTRRYSELQRIEDLLYVKAAELAFKEGFASDEETEGLMTKLGVKN